MSHGAAARGALLFLRRGASFLRWGPIRETWIGRSRARRCQHLTAYTVGEEAHNPCLPPPQRTSHGGFILLLLIDITARPHMSTSLSPARMKSPSLSLIGMGGRSRRLSLTGADEVAGSPSLSPARKPPRSRARIQPRRMEVTGGKISWRGRPPRPRPARPHRRRPVRAVV